MEGILENIQKVYLPYKSLNLDTVSFERLPSASNMIYKVRSINAPTIIYRQFGSIPLVDRAKERENFRCMSEAGVGPKCLGEGDNFRIEEFLPGRTLNRLELKEYATSLAKELSSFHKVRTGTAEIPFIIHAIQSWSQLFLHQSEMYLSHLNSDRKELFDEVLWLTTPEAHAEVFSLLPKTDNHVICHNDISYMNILKEDTKFTIIDYEFADMNWASSDLAYYMNEVMYDYSVPSYPSFELCRQDDFTTAEMNEFIESYCVNESILAEDMINEVIRMRPAINFMGALWAACNFLNEESEFDTLLYAKVRMNEYKRMREALI